MILALGVVDLGDLGDAFQSKLTKNQRLKLVLQVACHCLFSVILDAVDSESDDVLVAVLISDHDIDLVTEDFRKLLVDESHLKALVNHLVSIELKSEQPWALTSLDSHIICLHIVIQLNQNLILRNDSALRVRIIVDR